jgi:acetyl esterase/lipase
MRLLDQVYASPKGVPLKFDLLAPESSTPLPLVICLHGGGWISGEKEDMHEIVSFFAQGGFASAAVQYRLAPLYPFPNAIQDAMAFVRFARANAHSLNLDPNRLASIGNSAGGHLASMLGVLDRLPSIEAETEPSARVQAVIDLCGITDINDPRVQHNPIAWSFLEQFMEVPFEGNEAKYALASPVTHVDSKSAAFLIVHGEADDIVPIDQSERMAAALRGHGNAVEFVRLPDEGHAFSVKVWPLVAQTALDFLREIFNR